MDTSHALYNVRSTKGRHESLPALLLASTESVRRRFREDIQVSKALAFKIWGQWSLLISFHSGLIQ